MKQLESLLEVADVLLEHRAGRLVGHCGSCCDVLREAWGQAAQERTPLDAISNLLHAGSRYHTVKQAVDPLTDDAKRRMCDVSCLHSLNHDEGPHNQSH